MVTLLSERSHSLLLQSGYYVMFRTQAWSECLVTHGDERWLGRGVTDDESLEDALRQMLPSHCARELFRAQLALLPEAIASDVTSEPAASVLPLDATPALDETAAVATPPA